MAKRLEVYKCEACGNIVEVYHGGPGALVCCNEEMQLLTEKTADKTTEKHVPVIDEIEGGFKVTVGSTLHPMTDEHFIEWIELVADGKVYTQYLEPGQEPVAIFMVEAKEVYAREYCNLHGHWKS
jgi:superoxide reductase